MSDRERRLPVRAGLVLMGLLLVAGTAIADDDVPAFCRSGEGHPKFGRGWCIEKGFGLGGGPYFRRGGYGREHRFDDDHWKEAEKREREHEREYWKKRQEHERERSKHRQEMEREARKHYEELQRERRKHWEELDRESRKRPDDRGNERLARRWKPEYRSTDRFDARVSSPPTFRSDLGRESDPNLERERQAIADDRARNEQSYERY